MVKRNSKILHKGRKTAGLVEQGIRARERQGTVSKEYKLLETNKWENRLEKPQFISVSSESESTDDLNEEEKEHFLNFQKKTKQKIAASLVVVARNRALRALNILENKIKQSKLKSPEEKRLSVLKQSCNDQDHPEHSWDSAMYIVKEIRSCILTRNWNNLTDLLLLLLKQNRNKMYVSFVKHVAHLNFMNHPADPKRNILRKFYNLRMN